MNKYKLRIAALTFTILGATSATAAGDWQTDLHARDINKDGIVDAYYDSRQNITWLADANPAAGSIFDDGVPGSAHNSTTDGILELHNAVAWLNQLNVYGVTGWRFPDSGFRLNEDQPRNPEVFILYTETLGNANGRDISIPPNTGPFRNVATGTDVRYFMEANTNQGYAWYFLWTPGGAYGSFGDTAHAWAVHDGDIAAVPEIGTASMMAAGLALIGTALRQRRRA
jgi:hypothetical protein